MNTGEMVRTGLWLHGRETEAELQETRDWLKTIMAEMAEVEGDTIGEHRFYVMGPGNDLCPPPGPDELLFLVYEAKVTGHIIQTVRGRFCDELDSKDLERLITILLRVYPHYNPGKPPPTRETCMKWIDENGPEVAIEALRDQVGSTVH